MGYGAAGVDLFTGLLDTPGSYVGAAAKIAKVKASLDGLEFAVISKFTTTKVFDGATASPPTIYFSPLTLCPHHAFYQQQEDGIRAFGALVVGDYIYMFGGKSATGTAHYTNLHYRFNITTHLWEKRANVPVSGNTKEWLPVTGHHDGKIYWACQSNSSGDYKKILEYTIATDTWAVVADFPVQTDLDELWMVCCSDALYLHQSSSDFGQRMDKMDYTTKAWTACAADWRSHNACVIGDEIYAVNRITMDTYLYNKSPVDTWTDTGYDLPAAVGISSGCCYDEAEEEWWLRDSVALGSCPHWKFTPAAGWVLQFTGARHSYPWDWCLRRNTDKKLYCLWGYCAVIGGQNEPIASGSIQAYEPATVWELLTQTFNAGDLMILDIYSGVPVKVEKDGKLYIVSDGMSVVYVVDTGSYYFTLSKNFDMKGVDIYRSVWG